MKRKMTLPKTLALTIIAIMLAMPVLTHAAVLLSEGFEAGIPGAWSQEYVSSNINWTADTGGHNGNPGAAHSGNSNALFYSGNYNQDSTRLVTPAIDFTGNTDNPTLSFWLAMDTWGSDLDMLYVYYKTSAGGAWTLIHSNETELTAWTQQTVTLPNPGATYYIAFEGLSSWGYGVCIDDVEVTGTNLPAYIEVTPPEQGQAGAPGEVLTYQLNVRNKTGGDDTINLSYLTNWPASGPSSTGVLPDDSSTNITVTVDIPTGAFNGQVQTTTVDAVSVGTPSATDSAILISTCQWYPFDAKIYCDDFNSGWNNSGWTNYTLGDPAGWIIASPGSDGTGKCAFHNDDNVATGCVDWLVSPAIDLSSTTDYSELLFTFDNLIVFPGYYDYSGVMISTGHRDPASNDYVELLNVGSTDTTWTPRTIDISPYAGSNPVYFAFRYQGDWAHQWAVDQPCVKGRNYYPSMGTLSGQVYAAHSLQPIPGASVLVEKGATQIPLMTDPAGMYGVMLPSNDYDVIVSAVNYQSQTQTVVVTDNVLTIQDFALVGSMLTYGPPSITETVYAGQQVTNTVTVTNSGPLAVDYSLTISDPGFTAQVANVTMTSLPKISLPPFKGKIEHTKPSLQRAPVSKNNKPADAAMALPSFIPSAPCNAINLLGTVINEEISLTTDDPGNTSLVGDIGIGDAIYGADFLNGDFSELHALSNSNRYMRISTADGTPSIVGTAAPSSGHMWTGVAGDPNGTLFASSSDGSASHLYTINPADGTPTLIGAIGFPIIIDIAIDADGQMYGHDIDGDVIVSINKATAAGTLIGPTGFDANYAQGMDYDEQNGILYLAAYDITSQGHLRAVDTVTGNTTNLGVFGPAAMEADGFAIATLAIQWPVLPTNSGTIAAGSVGSFDVIFDGTAVSNAGTYTANLNFSGTFVNDVPPLPLEMDFIPEPAVFGLLVCALLAFRKREQ